VKANDWGKGGRLRRKVRYLRGGRSAENRQVGGGISTAFGKIGSIGISQLNRGPFPHIAPQKRISGGTVFRGIH